MTTHVDGGADKKAATGAGPDFNPAFVSLTFSPCTVELPNKGHFGANSFVPCREVVPISEVK